MEELRQCKGFSMLHIVPGAMIFDSLLTSVESGLECSV